MSFNLRLFSYLVLVILVLILTIIMYVDVAMHTSHIIIAKIINGILKCIQWGNYMHTIGDANIPV